MSDIEQINMRTVIEAQVKLSVIRWYSLMATCGAIIAVAAVAALFHMTPDTPWQTQCVRYTVPSIDKQGNAILVLPTRSDNS